MSKSLIIIAIVGIIILAAFSYFIFGFNQSSQKIVPPTQPTGSAAIPTELKIEDSEVGTGAEVKSGDTVVIHYTGTLPDGTKFDSSLDRNEPFETQIGVGQVIKGWDEGVVGMKVGGKRKLTIPPDMGYGTQAVGPIPANSTLLFDVELLEIK
ncbi:MAG: FKBP-type peptidyl-prolyl cis-trans isomerase [Patescibacteria group bacterium]